MLANAHMNVNAIIVHLHTQQCPVLETESTVRYAGHWQTVSTKAGITVRVSIWLFFIQATCMFLEK